MRKYLPISLYVFLLQVLGSMTALAIDLPEINSPLSLSSYKFFVNSQSSPSDTSQSQQLGQRVDSGYAYTIADSMDIYIAARIHSNSEQFGENGFLSGISYNFNDKLSIESQIHAFSDLSNNEDDESQISAEVTSRVKLLKNIDLHATLDYEKWQQGVEIGVGFRF